ncbi:hypothetical protein ABMC89_18225 [Sulfitobacter sp. HNIBRBA3233]|uniref:hypothetical protein n=1 Tax=Sulfitobacter marinivivus TaxID=3158558 RepID=UPI0032DF3FF8
MTSPLVAEKPVTAVPDNRDVARRVLTVEGDALFYFADNLPEDFEAAVEKILACTGHRQGRHPPARQTQPLPQQLRSAWGYNQIDTDIAVGWAPRPQ